MPIIMGMGSHLRLSAVTQMRHLTTWCGAIFSMVLLISAAETNVTTVHDKVTFSPEPAWALPPPAASPPKTKSDASELVILIDEQINAKTGETFRRMSRRILNQSGVDDASRLTFSFDPAYSTFCLHQAVIRRGTDVLDRRVLEKIQVLQREKDLELNLYDGRLSVVMILDDIRVGDQLEYAWSTIGRNPVFAGKFSDSILLQGHAPVQQLRCRLLWPGPGPMRMELQNTELSPIVRESAGLKDYVWELKDVPALSLEPGLPQWYDPFPWLHLSEFGSWQEVVAWALPLFQREGKLSESLENQIAAWTYSSSDLEQRLLAALQFVQDDVRYFGIEVGANSHTPSDPSTIFARRFGDCKDKTVLLCAILNRLGIEAAPALVHNQARIEKRLPGPMVFNHAIVRAKWLGKDLWLDPTWTFQRGPLKTRQFPDYGHALVVHQDTAGLTRMTNAIGALSRKIVRETVTLRDTTNQPALWRVATTYEGADAERARAGLSHWGAERFEKATLASYAWLYPLITTNSPMTISDNPQANRLETIANYEVGDTWQHRDPWRWQCEFHAHSIGALLTTSAVNGRKHPLGVQHPCRRLHTTIISLPANVRLKDETRTIRGPAEQLRYRRINSSQMVTVEFEYESLADFVPIDKLADHVRARSEMVHCLGTTITFNPFGARIASSAKQRKPPSLGWTAGAFGGLAAMVFFYLRQKRSEETSY